MLNLYLKKLLLPAVRLEVAVFDSLLVLLDILAIRQLEAGYRVKIMFCRSTIGDLLG